MTFESQSDSSEIISKNKYFNLSSSELSELELREKKDKTSCFLCNSMEDIYSGFKLTDKPRVNIYCELEFFPSSQTGKYIPRPVFFKLNKNLSEKEQSGKEKVRIEFSDSKDAENFWKVISFLYKYKELVDLGEFEKSYSVDVKSDYFLEFSTKGEVDKFGEIKELILTSDFSDVQMQLLLKENRLKTLAVFESLLNVENGLANYSDHHADLKGHAEEAIWHHYFLNNTWILGLNVDIKFFRDLISEADVGVSSTDGRGSPKADFLAIHDYTVLIELKKPSTKIFTSTKKGTARCGTWSFSSDFIDGVSQCLAQKSQLLKTYDSKNIVNQGKALDKNKVRNIDPKVIFIIGNKLVEFPEKSSSQDVLLKRDTFESFGRNNRNLDIITYDELYERANFIVNGEVKNGEVN